MRYRGLLPLATYPDVNSDVVISNALAIAEVVDADLHMLAITVDIPPVSSAVSEVLLGLSDKIRATEARSKARAEHLLDVARHRCADRKGLAVTMEQITAAVAFINQVAADRARYFDVCLVGWEAGNPTSRALAETVMFESGKPTIMLPELRSIQSGRIVAIAWDGSRPAARAVSDARPFLQRAEHITIVTVTDEKPLPDHQPGHRLAREMKEAGLDAEVVEVTAEGRSVSDTIQDFALDKGADLLVMGGYGHSRLREFVLGGATAGVLQDLRVPTLISH
jgi:nucleotide-binding universal stress UspA family protein